MDVREMKKRGMRKGNCSAKYTYQKKKGLDRDQKMEVMKLYETVEDRKVSEAVRVICG